MEEAVATALKNNYDILLLKNDSAVLPCQKKYNSACIRDQRGRNNAFNNNNVKQELGWLDPGRGGGIRSSSLASNTTLNWTLFDGLKMFATRDRLSER